MNRGYQRWILLLLILGLFWPTEVASGQEAPLTRMSDLPRYPATRQSGPIVEAVRERMKTLFAADVPPTFTSEVEVLALPGSATWPGVEQFYTHALPAWRLSGSQNALDTANAAMASWGRRVESKISILFLLYLNDPTSRRYLGQGGPVLIVVLIDGNVIS